MPFSCVSAEIRFSLLVNFNLAVDVVNAIQSRLCPSLFLGSNNTLLIAAIMQSPLREFWKGASVVTIAQFSRKDVETVIETARDMEKIDGKTDILHGKILANVFYEPSTRTAASFHAAMLRLGGDVIHIASSSSSSKKGETLQDTLRCLECYTDVVVSAKSWDVILLHAWPRLRASCFLCFCRRYVLRVAGSTPPASWPIIGRCAVLECPSAQRR